MNKVTKGVSDFGGDLSTQMFAINPQSSLATDHVRYICEIQLRPHQPNMSALVTSPSQYRPAHQPEQSNIIEPYLSNSSRMR